MDRKLTFKRVSDPDLIPTKYVAQNKHLDCDLGDYYKHLYKSANSKTKEGRNVPNLNCHLYVLIDDKNKIVGYLWAEKHELTGELWVCNVSIDQAHWNKGHVFNTIMPQLVEIMRREALKKVIWTTTHPKYYLAHGFKKSKQVMLEATQEDINGIFKTHRGLGSDADAPTAEPAKSGDRKGPRPVCESAQRESQPPREPALPGQSGRHSTGAEAQK